MRIRTLIAMGIVSAALMACSHHEESSPKQVAQNAGAQSGAAALPQSGNPAGAQTGNAAMPQDRNAATAQDRNAAMPQTGNPVPPAPADGVRRISIDDARAAVDQGRAVIFDVRSKDQFDEAHIAGAKCVPVGEVDDRLSEFPKDKLIVTYCA